MRQNCQGRRGENACRVSDACPRRVEKPSSLTRKQQVAPRDAGRGFEQRPMVEPCPGPVTPSSPHPRLSVFSALGNVP